jgi:hypothetical protein
MLPSNIPVLGIPLAYANTKPPTYKLTKCRTLGCKVVLPDDLPYCRGHRCKIEWCKASHITGYLYCGEHWYKEAERRFYEDWDIL